MEWRLGKKGFQRLLVPHSSRGCCCLEPLLGSRHSDSFPAAERAGTSVWRQPWRAATQLALVPYLGEE